MAKYVPKVELAMIEVGVAVLIFLLLAGGTLCVLVVVGLSIGLGS